MATKRTLRGIPREALLAGIQKCVDVATWRLREAGALLELEPPPVGAAAILFTFAIEEFGKAVLLREAFEAGQQTVAVRGFYDHQVKIDAASRHLGDEHLLLHRGAFDPRVFDSRVFDTGNRADLDARLNSLYVDWRAGQWRVGERVDRRVLAENIGTVTAIIARKRGAWTAPA